LLVQRLLSQTTGLLLGVAVRQEPVALCLVLHSGLVELVVLAEQH
jgi:hypothetical protein